MLIYYIIKSQDQTRMKIISNVITFYVGTYMLKLA